MTLADRLYAVEIRNVVSALVCLTLLGIPPPADASPEIRSAQFEFTGKNYRTLGDRLRIRFTRSVNALKVCVSGVCRQLRPRRHVRLTGRTFRQRWLRNTRRRVQMAACDASGCVLMNKILYVP